MASQSKETAPVRDPGIDHEQGSRSPKRRQLWRWGEQLAQRLSGVRVAEARQIPGAGHAHLSQGLLPWAGNTILAWAS